MDIPQHPKSTPASPLISTNTRSAENLTTPVSIEALNLEKDKIYQAVVSKLVDTKLPIPLAQTEKTTTAPESSEWLLKINGKLLRITSEKTLQPGQALQIKLSADMQTLTVLSTPTMPPTLTSQSNPFINSPLNNNAAVTTLLNAINHVMPRQVSLETGLKALTVLSQRSESPVVSNQAKLILSMLAKQAPDQSQLATAEKTTSSTTITNILKDSGVLFESSSKQHSHNPTSLKQQILQMQNAFNIKPNTPQTNTLQTPPRPPTAATLQQPTPEASKPNTTSSAFDAMRSAVLAKIQTTLQTSQTLQENSIQRTTISPTAQPNKVSSTSPLNTLLNSVTTSLNTSNKSTESSNIHNDLKGLLLSITAALKAETPNSKLSGRPHIDALAQLDLLNNPFNFPHFTNQSTVLTSSKAEALLADQQFTTGQLLKLIAGMLNRIQFNQLNSLYQSHTNTNETSTTQSWFFELPVTNPNQQLSTFDVRIDQEEDAQAEEQNDASQKIQWKLALSFKFEQLGAIYVQVTLAPPEISSTIWADQPATLALINREKKHFQAKLADLGLKVGDISCQKGQPIQDKTRLNQSLVDIKA